MPQPQTPQPPQTSQTPHSDAVQPQPQQPQNTESVGEAGSGLSDSYEKQPTPSESASSRSPTASNTASTPLSDLALRMGSFNTEAIAAEAAAMQAATLAAASYDMYGGQSKVAPGTGSPSSYYPWMKNYNSKLLFACICIQMKLAVSHAHFEIVFCDSDHVIMSDCCIFAKRAGLS